MGFVASAALYPFLAGDERYASPLSAYYFTCQPFPIEEVVEYYSMLSESLREGRYAPILNFVCEMYQRILNA